MALPALRSAVARLTVPSTPSPFLVLVVFLLLLYRARSRKHSTEPPVPWVGVSSWPFSGLIATIKGTCSFRQMLDEANVTHISANQPCIISNLVTGPLLILPPSCQKWMTSQPDHVLDRQTAQREIVAVQQLLWYAKTPFEPTLHSMPSRRWLASRVDEPQDDWVREIKHELRQVWVGENGEWRRVRVYKTLLSVVDRVAWQLVVGKALGQRKDLWRYGHYIIGACFVVGRLLAFLPPCLRHPAAMVLGLPIRVLFWRIKAILLPAMRTRMAELNAGREDAAAGTATDFLAWAVSDARQARDGAVRGVDGDAADRICSLVVQMIFATTHNLTITLSNTLLLLARAPPERGYMEALRAEVHATVAGAPPAALSAAAAAAAAATAGGPPSAESSTWTKQRVAALHGLDSTLREAMRLEPVAMALPIWTVVAQGGVVLPGAGAGSGAGGGGVDDDGSLPGGGGGRRRRPLALRRGTQIALPAYTVHTDAAAFRAPHDYDALRFAAAAVPLPLATPSPGFLAWSVGRTACPGRYWAAMAMKLVLAVMVSKYEIEACAASGPGRIAWRLGPIQIPNTGAALMVRKRLAEGGQGI